MSGTSAVDLTTRDIPVVRGGRIARLNRIRPRETIVFDQARLVAVCDRHGSGAEAHIASVLDAVEACIRRAEAEAEDVGALSRRCAEVAELADRIGMVTMRQAAHALRDCLDGDGPADRTARGACLDRLVRLGQAEGCGGWEMRGAGASDPAA